MSRRWSLWVFFLFVALAAADPISLACEEMLLFRHAADAGREF